MWVFIWQLKSWNSQPSFFPSANEFKRSVVFCCRGGGDGGRSLLVVTQQNSPVPPQGSDVFYLPPGSISVSGQLPTYPSLNPTLTLTCYQLTVVELGEGWVGSCSDTDIDPTSPHLQSISIVPPSCFLLTTIPPSSPRKPCDSPPKSLNPPQAIRNDCYLTRLFKRGEEKPMHSGFNFDTRFKSVVTEQ